MAGKRFLRLAVFLALVCASLPLALAGHAHDGCYDANHCVLCRVASTSIALISRPPQVPIPVTRVVLIYQAIGSLPISCPQAANRSRAPPGCLS